MREGREDGQREGRERKEGGRKSVGKEGREEGLCDSYNAFTRVISDLLHKALEI